MSNEKLIYVHTFQYHIFYTFAKMKPFLKILAYLFTACICIEILLHFYNPFTTQNDPLSDISVNSIVNINLSAHPGMDAKLTHSKNSIGFRGPNPSNQDSTRIFVIGGSTTECFYLSDNKDWPSVLGNKLKASFPGIWVNNAGISGHSLKDHVELLKKHLIKFKPEYLLIMSGIENIGPEIEPEGSGSHAFFILPGILEDIFKNKSHDKQQIELKYLRISNQTDTFEMNDSAIMKRLQKEQLQLGQYRSHLTELIDICKKHQITPVCIAQSILFSEETDPMTNVYLGNLNAGGISGRGKSLLLKMYNKIAYDLCAENNTPFINLSARMPKDSRFYYDGFHFTNEGSEMAASMIYEELISKHIITNKP